MDFLLRRWMSCGWIFKKKRRGETQNNVSVNCNLDRCKLCPSIKKIIGTQLLVFFIKNLILTCCRKTNQFLEIASTRHYLCWIRMKMYVIPHHFSMPREKNKIMIWIQLFSTFDPQSRPEWDAVAKMALINFSAM